MHQPSSELKDKHQAIFFPFFRWLGQTLPSKLFFGSSLSMANAGRTYWPSAMLDEVAVRDLQDVRKPPTTFRIGVRRSPMIPTKTDLETELGKNRKEENSYRHIAETASTSALGRLAS